MTKIDMNKEYTTSDGDEVRIYALDGHGNYPVHGAINLDGEWYPRMWAADGRYSAYRPDHRDLIEKPKTVRVHGYVNVYPDGQLSPSFRSRGWADSWRGEDRIACIKLDMEVEEGRFDDLDT